MKDDTTCDTKDQFNNIAILEKHSTAIDGLRALAVIAVIINHFNGKILPSGYLGVDIFFVISGFVITTSLVKREESDILRFFTGFYKRRVKRLLPALLLCFIITGVLISFFNPSPNKHIITGLFSIIGLSNIDLYFNAIDYWGDSAKLNPFTHTWSLGVEEQFYFTFPLIIWLTIRGNWIPSKIRRLQWLVLGASIISLFSFIYYSESDQVLTYFLMPFRFWEIGFGCALFLYLKHGGRFLNSFIALVPCPFFLIATVLALLIPKEYSVEATSLVVFLTVLLISKVKNEEELGRSSQFFLTNRSVLYIGKISYSLYLWHWVVIVISRWTIGINIWSFPFQIILIVAFSMISYHFFEKPLRHSSWSSSIRTKSFLTILFSLAVFLVASIFSNPKANMLYLGNPELKNRTKNMVPDQVVRLECNQKETANNKKQQFRVLGNSHSGHIVPMLKIIAEKCNIEIVREKHPNFIVIPTGGGISYLDSLDKVLSSLNKGDLLILSSRNRFLYSIPYLNETGDRWLDHTIKNKKNGYGLNNWLKELDVVINKTNKLGINVVLFLPNVEFDQPVLKYNTICLDEWFRIPNQGCNPSVSKKFLNRRFPKRFYKEVGKRTVQNNNFYTFDPLPIYCPQSQECSRIVNGVVAFADTNHLTSQGAILMLNEFSSFLNQNNLLNNKD